MSLAPASSTWTSRTSIRGSYRTSATVTWCAISARVAAVSLSKRSWCAPQPNSGSITRSPGAVESTIQIDSAISRSPDDQERPPEGLTDNGNRHPVPRKSRRSSGTDAAGDVVDRGDRRLEHGDRAVQGLQVVGGHPADLELDRLHLGDLEEGVHQAENSGDRVDGLADGGELRVGVVLGAVEDVEIGVGRRVAQGELVAPQQVADRAQVGEYAVQGGPDKAEQILDERHHRAAGDHEPQAGSELLDGRLQLAHGLT